MTLKPSYDFAIVSHFGSIHLLSGFGLWGITNGIWLATQHRIAEYRMVLKWTWFHAMGVASLANFIPSWTMNTVVFDQTSDAGWIIMVRGGIVLVYL